MAYDWMAPSHDVTDFAARLINLGVSCGLLDFQGVATGWDAHRQIHNITAAGVVDREFVSKRKPEEESPKVCFACVTLYDIKSKVLGHEGGAGGGTELRPRTLRQSLPHHAPVVRKLM